MIQGNACVPPKLLVEIEARFGPVREIEKLTGVAGQGGCQLLTGTKRKVALKTGVTVTERQFYEDFADELRSKGVATPQLYASGSEEQYGNWILLEYIPRVFPRHRWQHDPEQLKVLFSLHQATWGTRNLSLRKPYLPSWSESMTEDTMDWYARSTEARDIKDRLTEARLRFNELSIRDCSISGDTNPTNWRLREDGQLVLVDWERFGYGTPAFDLAVSIPGIGNEDKSTEQATAIEYLQHWEASGNSFPYTVETLTEQIILAKVFTMVELIEESNSRPDDNSVHTTQFMIRQLPLQLNKLSL